MATPATARRRTPQTPEKPAPARPRGRPPVISRERLLAIAREVFLELGIRTTTAEVAKRAGIAEGTLFHRFPSKEELFREAMRFDPEDVLAYMEALPKRAGQGDLRQTLVEFGEGFVNIARVALPVMMMAWSNPESELCDIRGGERGRRQRRVIEAVTAFFEAEMKRGRMARAADPEIFARMLLGSLHQFCMGEMFAGTQPGGSRAAEFVSGVVDVLLASAKTDRKPGAARAKREKRERS